MGSDKNFAAFSMLAVALVVPTVGAAMDIGMGTQVRLNAGYLSLNHDASDLTPPGGTGMGSYGDPTSILSYEPLYRADIEFVLTGRGEEGWFDLIAELPIAGGGTFGDRDYEAGQALFSETFSDIALGAGGNVRLRFGLPMEDELFWNGMTVRPYATAGLGLERYAANGLDCGAACPSGAFPDSITVIGQDLLTASAGLGVWLEKEISQAEAIDLRLEISGGYLGVSDSHYLRPDLGSVPNIAYDLATLGVLAEAGYRYETPEGVELSAGLFGGGQLGLGEVTFGNAGGGQTGPLTAWSFAGEAGVTLGASVAF